MLCTTYTTGRTPLWGRSVLVAVRTGPLAPTYATRLPASPLGIASLSWMRLGRRVWLHARRAAQMLLWAAPSPAGPWRIA